jgi:hypothetical protein
MTFVYHTTNDTVLAVLYRIATLDPVRAQRELNQLSGVGRGVVPDQTEESIPAAGAVGSANSRLADIVRATGELSRHRAIGEIGPSTDHLRFAKVTSVDVSAHTDVITAHMAYSSDFHAMVPDLCRRDHSA